MLLLLLIIHILKQIGTGTFNCFYYGFDKNKGIPVAMKIYKNKDKMQLSSKREIDYLLILKDEPHFPKIFDNYISEDKSLVIIESLHRPNLRGLLNFMNGKFPIKIVANIGIQLLSRIEALHKKGILHMDVTRQTLFMVIYLQKIIEVKKYSINRLWAIKILY